MHIIHFFISLLQNIIQKSPIVFLQLSEDEVGEFDLVCTFFFAEKWIIMSSPNNSTNIFNFIITGYDITPKLCNQLYPHSWITG